MVSASLVERNLLADASSVVEKNKNCKRKDEQMKAVANGLRLLGYDASISKSRWEKTPSFPAGTFLLRLPPARSVSPTFPSSDGTGVLTDDLTQASTSTST